MKLSEIRGEGAIELLGDILIPATEKAKVVQPIIAIAGRIFTLRNAKVMPTARASMLVAIASTSIALNAKEAS